MGFNVGDSVSGNASTFARGSVVAFHIAGGGTFRLSAGKPTFHKIIEVRVDVEKKNLNEIADLLEKLQAAVG